MGNPNQSEVCAPSSTYRELPGDRIEAHVDRVLEISWVRYIRLRVVVRRLGPLDLVLQRLLLAVQVLGLCKRCEEQMGSSVQGVIQFVACLYSPFGRGLMSTGGIESPRSLPPRLLVRRTGGAGGLSSSLDIADGCCVTGSRQVRVFGYTLCSALAAEQFCC